MSEPTAQSRLRTLPVPDERTALYRLKDATGRLVYIGISADPLRRWLQHAAEKPWWEAVSDFSIQWFESRSAALTAESNAIRTERPLYNVHHNPNPADSRTARWLRQLDEATAAYESTRRELDELIADARQAGVPLTAIAEHSPYSREWVRRIAARINSSRADEETTETA